MATQTVCDLCGAVVERKKGFFKDGKGEIRFVQDRHEYTAEISIKEEFLSIILRVDLCVDCLRKKLKIV